VTTAWRFKPKGADGAARATQTDTATHAQWHLSHSSSMLLMTCARAARYRRDADNTAGLAAAIAAPASSADDATRTGSVRCVS
jgi:hypothetical protein